jgi:hypothetical protein
MRGKKTLKEELYRINQVMVNSSSDILLEQGGPEAKIINKVLDDVITPDGLITLMDKVGFKTDGVIPNFLNKFDDLIVFAKGGDEWNEIIQKASKTKTITRYFNELGEEIDPSEIVGGAKVTMETDYYRILPDGKNQLIDEKTYKEIVENNSEYYAIPPFLRLPINELESMIKSVNGGSIKNVEELLRSLQSFLKGAPLTDGLKKVIVSLMGANPKFTKILKKALMKSPDFTKRVKYAQYKGTIDELIQTIADTLGLEKTNRLINDLGILVSKEGELLETYFSFLTKAVDPMKVYRKWRFGNYKNIYKLIFSDVLGSGFYNYIMGGAFLKKAFNYVAKLGNKNIKTSEKIMDSLYGLLIGTVLFGGYRSLRDKDIKQMNPVEWFQSKLESFNKNCVGNDKVSDALTGRLYKNVVGSQAEAETPGAVTKCKDVEFTKAFLNSYAIEKDEDVKASAEALYATLNNNAAGGNWWTFGDGEWYKQTPSITKIIVDYMGLFRPEDVVVDAVIKSEGMGILKLSQISDYYETNFKASLYEDMQNMNQWAGLLKGASWEDVKTEILKLPYLDGGATKLEGQSKINYDTWQEMVTENKKSVLRYPQSISYDDGDFEIVIPLAICGSGCKSGDESCNCNDGGCSIGGTYVEVPVAIELNKKGVSNNSQFAAFCAGKDGFDNLKEIYDTAAATGGGNDNCKLRPGQ